MDSQKKLCSGNLRLSARRGALFLPFALLPVAAVFAPVAMAAPAGWVVRNGWLLKAGDR